MEGMTMPKEVTVTLKTGEKFVGEQVGETPIGICLETKEEAVTIMWHAIETIRFQKHQVAVARRTLSVVTR